MPALLLALTPLYACSPAAPNAKPATTPDHHDAAANVADASSPEAKLLRAWMDAFNRRDMKAVLDMFTDDGVAIGTAFCKGKGCVGKEQIRKDFVDPSFEFHFIVDELTLLRTSKDYALAWWAATPAPEHRPKGARTIRGRVWISIRDGLIQRMAYEYDMADPSTALFRASVGEYGMAIQYPQRVENTPMRALLSDMDVDTAVVVYRNDYLVDRVADGDLVSRIHKGTCAKPGEMTYELAPFIHGHSETLTKSLINDLVKEDSCLVITTKAGETIGCGNLPTWEPKPAAPPK